MPQTQELKPKTIRISDETMNAFRQISSSIGANQDIALAKLLETYKMQQEKATLPEMKKQIEAFEDHMSFLTQTYIQALTALNDQEDSIAARYQQQIHSQKEQLDSTKQELQAVKAQLTAAQDGLKKAESKNQELQKQLDRLQQDLKTQQNTTYSLAALNNNLKESNEKLEEQISDFEKDREEFEALREEHKRTEEELQKSQEELKQNKRDAEQTIAALKSQSENEKEQLKLHYESELQKELRRQEAAQQEEMRSIRSKQELSEKQYQERLSELLHLLIESKERTNALSDQKAESKVADSTVENFQNARAGANASEKAEH